MTATTFDPDPARLSRWVRDLLVRTGSHYGLVLSTDGRSFASIGEPPCAPARVAPLVLTIADGAAILLGSGSFERAQVHLRGGILLVYRLNSACLLAVFARGPAHVTRQLKIAQAIDAARGEFGDASGDGFVRIRDGA